MTTTPITLRKENDKIRIENRFGNLLAFISKFDTEFFEPVTETELLHICKVARDFEWYSEIITK